MYTEKYHEQGNIQRLKSHLLNFGHHQVEDINYNGTYAPVAK